MFDLRSEYRHLGSAGGFTFSPRLSLRRSPPPYVDRSDGARVILATSPGLSLMAPFAYDAVGRRTIYETASQSRQCLSR